MKSCQGYLESSLIVNKSQLLLDLTRLNSYYSQQEQNPIQDNRS